MDKVKLPPEVSKNLDTISRMDGYQMRLLEALFNSKYELSAEMKVIDKWVDQEHGNFEILLQALVIGYEVETTPEDKVRELFGSFLNSNGGRQHYTGITVSQAIQEVVGVLGHKIEGVNA